MHTLKTMKSFTDPHTLKQRMKSVHYNFLPHKKRIVSCKKRIERQSTVQEKYCIVRVTECIVYYTNRFPYWGNILHGCGGFSMSMYITFLHVQLLIFYTLNTENDYIKKNLIIYNYKNLSIAFGPEYTLFIHYNFYYVLTVFLSH